MNRPTRTSILVTLLASAVLQLLSGCLPDFGIVYFDTDEDGYSADVDCNDADASVYPGGSEIALDGIDQDCNDGDYTVANDLDFDGYAADVDCDDNSAAIYPGAPDPIGDWIDRSCDGIDGLAPSVGLPTSTVLTIQEALNTAQAGQTVWVGPGTYHAAGLMLKGKALRLASTHGEAATIIDGGRHDTVFKFTDGETSASVVQGFTLQNGYALTPCETSENCPNRISLGGGIYMDHASPTLRHLTLTMNEAFYGGGMFMESSTPTLKDVTFFRNRASSLGAGMHLNQSSPTLINVTFRENEADFNGGGMYVTSSSPTLTNVTFRENKAGYGGGGMYVATSSPILTNVSLAGNEADSGGGMFLSEASPTLNHVTLTGSEAYYAGGGIYLYQSSPILQNSILAYNRAGEAGGNLYLSASETNSPILSYYSLLFNPSGWMVDNVTPSGSLLTMEPQFLDYADASTGESCSPGSSDACRPSDLHLALSSPLVNAGDPTELDADGSRADIGSYGGQGGARWDVDLDGVSDYFWPGEWEDAPFSVDPLVFDRNDLDPDVR